jgi:hypothetical protein
MLRSNLRSVEGSRQGGWLDTLLPRRPKMLGDQDSACLSRVNLGPPAAPTVQESSEDSTWIVTNSAMPADFPPSAPLPQPSEQPVASRDSRAVQGDRKITAATVFVFGSIASVALFEGMGAWANATLLATMFLLGVSILAFWNRHDARRAYWQGFALFGWGYLIMAFAPWSPPQFRAELPTSRLVVALHSQVAAAPESAPIENAGPGFALAPPKIPSGSFAAGSLAQFQAVGHSLFALAAAFLGAGIAGWFYRTDLASG